MRRVVSMILAGGQGPGLGVLTRHRPASAVPFGGKYRVIDFALSNCVNSDIYRVCVLTQYAPTSLNEHIRTGRPWDLDRREAGVRLLQAYARREGLRWYRGTADAIAQNVDVIHASGARWVLVLSGDQVYKMDYSDLIAAHQRSSCPMTLTVKRVPETDCHRFGIVDVDDRDRLLSFEEKPRNAHSQLANLGIYVFDADFLTERLSAGAVTDVVTDLILPVLADDVPIHCQRFDGYWDDVGTIDSFFRSNMELLLPGPRLNLADPDWRIYTPSEERPPFRCGPGGKIARSLVANGARVDGEVRDSILFPGAVVERGALVESSIVMQDAVVSAGARVDLAILDKHVTVGSGAIVGHDTGTDPDSTLRSNVVVIGKGADIPAGLKIGRRCVIDIGADGTDFSSDELLAGSTVQTGS